MVAVDRHFAAGREGQFECGWKQERPVEKCPLACPLARAADVPFVLFEKLLKRFTADRQNFIARHNAGDNGAVHDPFSVSVSRRDESDGLAVDSGKPRVVKVAVPVL